MAALRRTMVTDVCAGLSALRIEDVLVGQIVVVGLGLSELAALNGHVTRQPHFHFVARWFRCRGIR